MPRNNVLHIRPSWSPVQRLAKPQLTLGQKTNTAVELNPAVNSLYRTFLRAISASLLHHSTGTRCLRGRYRTAFEQYFQLHQSHKAPSKTKGEILEWDVRFDNTLQLLQNSATSRGLPHQLTRNLSLLVNARSLEQAHTAHPKWDPNRGVGKKSPTINQTESLAVRVDDILEENLELAEGTARVVLGRIHLKH